MPGLWRAGACKHLIVSIPTAPLIPPPAAPFGPRRSHAGAFRSLEQAHPDVLAKDIDGYESIAIDERYGDSLSFLVRVGDHRLERSLVKLKHVHLDVLQGSRAADDCDRLVLWQRGSGGLLTLKTLLALQPVTGLSFRGLDRNRSG